MNDIAIGVFSVAIFIMAAWGLARGFWAFLEWRDPLPPKPHPVFCSCSECREKYIREEVEKREWHKMRDEVTRAVEEMHRESGRK
jgi:hypothetical protein